MSISLPMARKLLVRVFFCAVAGYALAGCVTKTQSVASTAGYGKDLVTASDESNERKRARLRLELAIGYFQHGETTVALDEIKQALIADPNYAEAYNMRGLIYMRLSDAGLAEDSFRRSIALSPQNPNTLHNYGWLLCQQNRFGDAMQQFAQALGVPNYGDAAKTLMTQGICQLKAGQRAEAEQSLLKAYEMDPGNAVIGFNLASLLAQRQDWSRAQFYIRRVNNSPSANAETLWLGIKIERHLGSREVLGQLASELQRRFPQSSEALAYERGNFND